MLYIVLYEHYLQDRKIEVIGVFDNKDDANEAWKKSFQNRNFRDECWVVERELNIFHEKKPF